MLIDLVSRGGNFLLDIGPTADGRIPVIMEERLLQIGKWLDVNGDAIYGTKPWVRSRQFSEGEQLKLNTGRFMQRYEITDYVDRKKPGQAVIEAFFTAKGNDVFAIVPGWPGKRFVLKGVSAGPSFRASLLGRAGDLKWTAVKDGIAVELPESSADAATASYAHTLRLTGLK
jgi:alpha-L-fucosidase